MSKTKPYSHITIQPFVVFAQKVCFPGSTTCVEGPLPTGRFDTLADIVNQALLFIFPIAGLLLFVNILRAGFGYLASAGDPKKMEAAKGRLTTSFIGFIILFLAFWITQIVAFIFGIEGIF